MIIDFATSETGTYLLTTLLAIAAGLIPTRRSIRGWCSVGLITAVFIFVALERGSDAPWAGPIYVLVYAVTTVLAAAHDLKQSDVVGGESYGRRIGLALTGGSRVRAAEAAFARETTEV